jgi:hypothetical protein
LAKSEEEIEQLKTNLVSTARRWAGWEVLTKSRNPPYSFAWDDSSYVTGIELFVDGGMAQI